MRDANDTQYVLREAVAFSPLSIARMVNGGAFLPEPDNAHLSGVRIGYRGSGRWPPTRRHQVGGVLHYAQFIGCTGIAGTTLGSYAYTGQHTRVAQPYTGTACRVVRKQIPG